MLWGVDGWMDGWALGAGSFLYAGGGLGSCRNTFEHSSYPRCGRTCFEGGGWYVCGGFDGVEEV